MTKGKNLTLDHDVSASKNYNDEDGDGDNVEDGDGDNAKESDGDSVKDSDDDNGKDGVLPMVKQINELGYRDLRRKCKDLNLGGNGNKDFLRKKLIAHFELYD